MIRFNTVLGFFLGFFLVFHYGNSQYKSIENENINSLLEKKRKYNRENGIGFSIQLYNGSEIIARRIKQNFTIKFPGQRSELKYEEPDWKVKVGRYYTKLQADRALNKIREQFSGAIIIPY